MQRFGEYVKGHGVLGEGHTVFKRADAEGGVPDHALYDGIVVLAGTPGTFPRRGPISSLTLRIAR